MANARSAAIAEKDEEVRKNRDLAQQKEREIKELRDEVSHL